LKDGRKDVQNACLVQLPFAKRCRLYCILLSKLYRPLPEPDRSIRRLIAPCLRHVSHLEFLSHNTTGVIHSYIQWWRARADKQPVWDLIVQYNATQVLHRRRTELYLKPCHRVPVWGPENRVRWRGHPAAGADVAIKTSKSLVLPNLLYYVAKIFNLKLRNRR
jgi:hypothetical protein